MSQNITSLMFIKGVFDMIKVVHCQQNVSKECRNNSELPLINADGGTKIGPGDQSSSDNYTHV